MKKYLFKLIIISLLSIIVFFSYFNLKIIDNILIQAGFKFENFIILNRQIFSQKKIFEVATKGIDLENTEKASLFFIDIQKIFNNLIESNLFELVVVKKVFPSTIQIYIEEKKPFALFHQENDIFLIDDQGSIISKDLDILNNNMSIKNEQLSYIHLFGVNANLYARSFFYQLNNYIKQNNINYSLIQQKLIGLSLIENRRWDLIFNDGLIVKMPTSINDKMFILLEKFLLQYSTTKIQFLDLRDEKKIYIKYRDT